MCSHTPEDGGAFSHDPAPGKKKFCWCTPTSITELLGDLARASPEKCATEADAEFFGVEGGRPGVQVAFRAAANNKSFMGPGLTLPKSYEAAENGVGNLNLVGFGIHQRRP